MDAFHGAGQRHGSRDGAAASLSRGEAKDGAQSFSAGKEGITHGLVNRWWTRVFFGKKSTESAINQLLAREEIRFEIHAALSVCAIVAAV